MSWKYYLGKIKNKKISHINVYQEIIPIVLLLSLLVALPDQSCRTLFAHFLHALIKIRYIITLWSMHNFWCKLQAVLFCKWQFWLHIININWSMILCCIGEGRGGGSFCQPENCTLRSLNTCFLQHIVKPRKSVKEYLKTYFESVF